MKICLTMIVKDEAHVLERCLGALKPHIDCALIIDTGSTDSTVELIPKLLDDVTIEHSPFISFRHNRTELLERARVLYPKADYHLMMDADDTWVVDDDFKWPVLTEDSYEIWHKHGSLAWWRPQILRASKPFRYEGAAHEYATCDEAFSRAKLEGVFVRCGSDGARRKNEPLKKYERVAGILEREYQEDPSKPRTVFYLAQSYRDSGRPEDAIEMYRERAGMPGWAEEAWFSIYQIGRLQEQLGYPLRAVIRSYMEAYQARPHRAEPLVAAASISRRRGERASAFMYASAAVAMPFPVSDRLFVDSYMYEWRRYDEYAMACWHQKRMGQAIWANFQILSDPKIEGYPRDRILSNISYCCRPKGKFEVLKAMWKQVNKSKEKDRLGLLEHLLKDDDLNEFSDLILGSIRQGGMG